MVVDSLAAREDWECQELVLFLIWATALPQMDYRMSLDMWGAMMEEPKITKRTIQILLAVPFQMIRHQ